MADVWLENVWIDGIWHDGVWVDETDVDYIIKGHCAYTSQLQELMYQLQENKEQVDYNKIEFSVSVFWFSDEAPIIEKFVYEKQWKNVIAEAVEYESA